jgi:aminoglycoside 3-N-acetyltransferase
MLNFIFERFSIFEILAKNIFGRSEFLQKKRKKRVLKKSNLQRDLFLDKSSNIQAFCDALRGFGVKTGDIVIVHSSSDFCTLVELSPRKIIELLQEVVGVEGTIAMPAIPIVKDEPKGVQRLSDSKYENVLTYNVQRSPPWTGILPRQLMQMPDSVRSQHPLNTMVALGPQAQAMMDGNLKYEPSKPCGPNSSWDYCHGHNAHIVALDCDLAHSLTMVHLKEDMAGTDWPISESSWYRKREFKIIDGQNHFNTHVLERRASWSMFFAERRLSYLLFKHEVAFKKIFKGITISYCRSRELTAFIEKQNNPVFPYWIPFLSFMSRLKK